MDTIPFDVSPVRQEQLRVYPAREERHQQGTKRTVSVGEEVSLSITRVRPHGGMPKGYPREDLFFEGGTW